MKTYAAIFWLILITSISFAQDHSAPDSLIDHSKEFVPPFTIKGNTPIYPSTEVLPRDMTGMAVFEVAVDDEGKLINFAVFRVNVQDSLGNKAIIYDNYDHNLLYNNGPELQDGSYLPGYVRFLFEDLKKVYANLTVIKKEKTAVRNDLLYIMWVPVFINHDKPLQKS